MPKPTCASHLVYSEDCVSCNLSDIRSSLDNVLSQATTLGSSDARVLERSLFEVQMGLSQVHARIDRQTERMSEICARLSRIEQDFYDDAEDDDEDEDDGSESDPEYGPAGIIITHPADITYLKPYFTYGDIVVSNCVINANGTNGAASTTGYIGGAGGTGGGSPCGGDYGEIGMMLQGQSERQDEIQGLLENFLDGLDTFRED